MEGIEQKRERKGRGGEEREEEGDDWERKRRGEERNGKEDRWERNRRKSIVI